MVKSTSSSVSVPENTVPAVAVVAVAPESVKPKTKRAPKKEASADASVAVESVVENPTEQTSESSDKTDLSSELNDEISELLKLLQNRSSLDNQIKNAVKGIEKKVARMSKLMEKSSKRKRSSGSKVSGFEKPTPISDELAKFVGEPNGALLARTAISKKIHEYVKANNLQDPKNRRIINPDAKLKKLLKTGPTDELSYFNLQKFLKVHFKK
jgi:chromatin remodeling complex protein RSC6